MITKVCYYFLISSQHFSPFLNISHIVPKMSFSAFFNISHRGVKNAFLRVFLGPNFTLRNEI